MKNFVDMHLRPPLEKPEQTEEIIRKSAELGYHSVGVVFPPETTRMEIQKIRDMCDKVGLDLVTRVDLTPETSGELLNNLRKLRRKFEVIAVCCYSKVVARQAAKDQRVDLLSFPSTDPKKRFFDLAEAELASKAAAYIEVDMAPLLYLSGFQRVRLLSLLREEMSIAKKFGVPIVLSSGTREIHFLRKPEDYASLAYLFGLDQSSAKQAISENPRAIIERNRRKLGSDYVAPGIYIVREGGDCLGG
jgi:RNase P/RNase MRP subunit p30